MAGALLVAPAGAAAHTKTVYAGPPPSAHAAVNVPGKKFVTQNSPDENDFFQHRVTINSGDTMSFVIAGFHTIDLPAPARAIFRC